MEDAFISSKVFVLDGPCEDIGYCFLPSMWVIWEACAIATVHVIKHEEWREVALIHFTAREPTRRARYNPFQAPILGSNWNLATGGGVDKPLGILAFPDTRFPMALGSAFLETSHPNVWNNKAIGLVSDESTAVQLDDSFIKAMGKLALTSSGLPGKAVKAGVKELQVMVDWFRDEGTRRLGQSSKKPHPGH
ncbi:hypothetical protein HG530_011638 [Fusarium avenaceum]|nr:hypothetical protein HG530_011638 [Fusarium avenaceum]